MTDSLGVLLSALNEQVGGIWMPYKYFRRYVMVHNSALFAAFATIDFGISISYIDRSLASAEFVYYFRNYDFPKNAECFVFVAFM